MASGRIFDLTRGIENCIFQTWKAHPGTEPRASALGFWSTVWQQQGRAEVKEGLRKNLEDNERTGGGQVEIRGIDIDLRMEKMERTQNASKLRKQPF